jgi:large repetitive protein
VKTIGQVGRGASAHALSEGAFCALRVVRKVRRVIGAVSFACATLLVSFGAAQAQTATTTTFFSSQNPSIIGTSVVFNATVAPVPPGSGTPTGTVTFFDGGTQIGTTTLAGGNTAFSISTLSVGSHTITATYNGDSNFSGSSGSLDSNPQVVKVDDTTIDLTSNVNPVAAGSPVAFQAVVKPAANGSIFPTGTVTYFDGATQIAAVTLNNGTAIFTTSSLAPGNHIITAKYSGDGNFNGSTGSLTGNPQVVTQDTSSIVLAPSTNPSTFGQPVTFTATVNGTGNAPPTGNVTFTDTTTSQTLGAVPLATVGGQQRASLTISTLSVGSHNIQASYGGDAIFSGSTTSIGVTVNKANVGIALTSSANPSVLNQPVTFTATVSNAQGNPTGTVTFTDLTTSQTLGTVTLSSGQATVTTSTLTAGSHNIQASYSGDGSFNGRSITLTQTVATTGATTALVSSLNPSTVGQSVTFTATVSASGGTPTGNVTFSDLTAGQILGTVNLTTVAGQQQAAFSTSALTAGSHTIQATYNGDTVFTASSATVNQLVNKLNSATKLQSSPNPSTVGQAVTFTAMVTGTGGTPTGSVTFTDATGNQTLATVTLSGGTASFTTSTLVAGSHTIQATYSGDGLFTVSSDIIGNQVVNQASSTTTLTSSQNPSVFGQTAVITATVSGSGSFSPTGTVTFVDLTTSQTIGTVTLVNTGGSQQASVSLPSLAPGTHNIKATYNGDSNFTTSNATLAQVVNKATPTTALVSSVNPSSFGQSVTFTATVSSSGGTPTGSVTFTDQTTSQTLGTITLSGGKASATTAALTAGNHTIQASYNGDGNFTTSTASLTQVVNRAISSTALTSSANPSTFGQSVTFTATVTGSGGTPTGSVTFTDQTTSQTLGTVTLSGGQATVTPPTLTAGSHTIQATYSGDSNVSPNSVTLNQVVNKANSTTTLTSSANPSTFGQSVTFTAKVSSSGGTPTGSVTFTDLSTSQSLGTVTLSGGQASVTPPTLSGGPHVIRAIYGGDNNFGGSSVTLLQTVNQASTTMTLTSSVNPSAFGQSVTFTATVASSTGTPTGSVIFSDLNTSQVLGTVTLSGGQAMLTTSALPIGFHLIQARYSGDTNFATNTATLNQIVGQATTTTALTASPNPSTPGQSVTFTATVKVALGSGTPTGTVTFKDGMTVLGTSPLAAGGTATFTTSSLTPGSHSITAVYNGDTNFAGSTSAPLIE